MDRVILGEEYVDAITGYTGTATARNEIYGGLVSVKIERLDNSGSIEETWITESRLKAPNGPPKEVGFA